MKNAIKLFLTLLLFASTVNGQKYSAQDGRLLDANNRLGSMGWNSSGSIDALSNRNNGIFTGNISGGMRFQGAVPYSNTLEFQGNTTSTLTNFRRDSVGVSQLSTGLNYGQLYIDPARSLTTSHNGNIINTQSISRISTMLNQQVQSAGHSNFLNNSLTNTDRTKINLGSYINNNTIGYTIPGISYLQTGITSSDMAMNLSITNRENTRLNSLAKDLINKPVLQRSSVLAFTNNQSDFNIDEQLFLEKDMPDRIFEEDIIGSRVATETLTLQQIEMKYQEYYLLALKDMKKGSYFKAADNFELARVFAERDNAEIYVNIALARFAAGEYISSSLNLYRAFTLSFQQSMTPIELQKLFNSEQTVSEGIEHLQRSYNLTQNSSMLFLKGYLEFLNNDLNSAKSTFQQIITINPDDKLFPKILTELEKR